MPTKQRVITNLIRCLKSTGYLIVGHSETLNGLTDVLVQMQPTVYRLQ
jgi:chemotaxis protein methyltransferase CheR